MPVTVTEEDIKYIYQLLKDKFVTKKEFEGVQSAVDFIDETIPFDQRKEFKDLWDAQRLEAEMDKLIKSNTGSSLIREYVTQISDARPDKAVVQKVLAAESAVDALIALVDKNREHEQRDAYTRFVANLSLAYILMAVHFKSARDHVTAVIAEKSITDKLLAGGLGLCQAALAAGLAALTGGVSGLILGALAKSIPEDSNFEWLLAAAPKDHAGHVELNDANGNAVYVKEEEAALMGLAKPVDDNGALKEGYVEKNMNGSKIWVQTEKAEDATIFERSGALKAAKDFTQATTLEKAGNLFAAPGAKLTVGRITGMLSTDGPQNPNQDPFEFFLNKEKQLREIAAYINSIAPSNISELRTLEVDLPEKKTLDQLRNDPNWKVLFEQQPNKQALDEIWEHVSRLLFVNMKRLCWREFCRSQWNNAKYDYTISVMGPKDAEKNKYIDSADATEWHYKIWRPTSWPLTGMPRHWNQICYDFKGPEHVPEDRFTISFGCEDKAKKAEENKAWISMAAVQCCQIRRQRFRWFGQGWDIDLEKFGHDGGAPSSEPIPNKCSFSDKDLVYGDPQDQKYLDKNKKKSLLKEYLRKICVKGGMTARISKVSFGESSTKGTRASGKSFRIEQANTAAAPENVTSSISKVTVEIKREDHLGNPATSGTEVRVQLYKANEKKHDGKTDCNKEDQCWYCLYSGQIDETNPKAPPKTYRLKRVDEKTDTSYQPQVLNMNYVNFFLKEPGLYCIRLDPRLQLQVAEGRWRSLQTHVSDEWWFRVQTITPYEPQMRTNPLYSSSPNSDDDWDEYEKEALKECDETEQNIKEQEWHENRNEQGLEPMEYPDDNDP